MMEEASYSSEPIETLRLGLALSEHAPDVLLVLLFAAVLLGIIMLKAGDAFTRLLEGKE